jgi:hypothetical protein
VARTIDSSGDIETVSKTDPARSCESVKLVFTAEEEVDPPFVLKIKSPSGGVIMERVLRELPTGKPQSAPPIEFTPSAAGEYKIEIKQIKGKKQGDAILRVID